VSRAGDGGALRRSSERRTLRKRYLLAPSRDGSPIEDGGRGCAYLFATGSSNMSVGEGWRYHGSIVGELYCTEDCVTVRAGGGSFFNGPIAYG
jgi:hypothetical protein